MRSMVAANTYLRVLGLFVSLVGIALLISVSFYPIRHAYAVQGYNCGTENCTGTEHCCCCGCKAPTFQCGSCGCSDGGGCTSKCGACFNCDVCVTTGAGDFILTDQGLATIPRYSSADQGEGEVKGIMTSCSVAYAEAWVNTETWGTVEQVAASTGSGTQPTRIDKVGMYAAIFGLPLFLFLVFVRLVPFLRKPIRFVAHSRRRSGKR